MGLGANLNRCADTPADANRRPRLDRGRPRARAGAGRGARAPRRCRSSTRARARGARRATPRRTSPRSGSGLPRAPCESVFIHAVYLINVASDDAEVRRKSLAVPHACAVGGRRDRRRRRGRASGQRQGTGARADVQEARKGDEGGARANGVVPVAVREHRRRGVHDRPHVRGAGEADRGVRRRTRASACASTRAICLRPATRSASPRPREGGRRRVRRRRRDSTGCARCT